MNDFSKGFILGIIIAIVIFIIVGKILLLKYYKKNNVGILNVDRSDPYDEPYLFLELDKEVEYISKHEYVTFRVRNKNYVSRN